MAQETTGQSNNPQRKIINKFEIFLLIFALAILGMVILQNRGINMVEITEKVEISEAELRAIELEKQAQEEKKEANTLYKKPDPAKERLSALGEYFANNRAAAREEGTLKGFDWSSLTYSKDEVAYLKNQYEGKESPARSAADWVELLASSYQTYSKVKSSFQEAGIDVDEFINAEQAAKLLTNPLVAQSVYKKIETEFGIPTEQSAAFAKKNQHNLEEWAKFVETQRKGKQ